MITKDAYNVLSNTWMTTGDVAAVLGIPRKSAWTALRALAYRPDVQRRFGRPGDRGEILWRRRQ